MPKFKQISDIIKIVKNLEQIRNAGIIAHVDHGKTTLTDSLLAAAGVLSPSVAGEALALDYLEEEQQRQMTIKAANISLFYERGEKGYVVNLVDTPGHVDFSGRVTRALRAIDGAVVVVDAVEEVMVQTETVTRQALEERVRPVVYINKIDRLVKELRLTPEQIQAKIGRIISDFNRLIDIYAEPQYRDIWKVSPASGTVAFGSAKDRWGFTAEIAQRHNLRFQDVLKTYESSEFDELKKKLPLHEAILNMIIDHMPPPHVAQKYRIPKIWHGDLDSEVGKAMVNCDENGPTVMCVTDVKVDPQAGIVATGRLFSGTLNGGDTVNLMNAKGEARVQQVCIYMGPYREIAGSLIAGNIPALLGLEAARSGETISSVKGVFPFELVKYVSEPVVTIAVEPKNSKDLPKLVDFLNKLSIEDPTLVTTVRPETGEYLIAGMGTLHLEIAQTWIQKAGLEIISSKPITIYRESIRGRAGPIEGKSPNKHNKIYLSVEPLEPEVIELIRKGTIFEGLDRKEMAKILREYGWDTNESRNVWVIDEHGCMLIDGTKGLQYLREVKEMIISGFTWTSDEGPLANEVLRGVKARLTDAQLHEDPVHRGPAQIMPATKYSLLASLLLADPTILEPIMKATVKVPIEYIGGVTKVLTSKRGRVVNIEQKEHLVYVIGELPASETFDLSEQMRSATSGRAFWGLEFGRWEIVPQSIQGQLIQDIRKRKGLSPTPPKAQDFME
ncbi:elongation factor EF-2 [Candidatus Bathyarchaeota archaeon RBG_16_48_13]|nr:MAG: elongation factor EF-2 [Candidatus Bathyarchaeota archaeon RBG_16_48_13]